MSEQERTTGSQNRAFVDLVFIDATAQYFYDTLGAPFVHIPGETI
jgi:hypothetical protein